MRLVLGGFDEVFGKVALSDQPALHIDRAGKHGGDLASLDVALQLIETRIASMLPLRRTVPVCNLAKVLPGLPNGGQASCPDLDDQPYRYGRPAFTMSVLYFLMISTTFALRGLCAEI